MNAWTYNQDHNAYVYVFEGYEAIVYQCEDCGMWAYVVLLEGRTVTEDEGFELMNTAMNTASNAIWDDYHGSVALLDFCGA